MAPRHLVARVRPFRNWHGWLPAISHLGRGGGPLHRVRRAALLIGRASHRAWDGLRAGRCVCVVMGGVQCRRWRGSGPCG